MCFQDDESINCDRTLDRIINGVFHHPALRNVGDDGARDGRGIMFDVVEEWWGSKSDYEKDDLRQKLSREGVQTGQNHKEGVEDTGHGCCKPLGLAKPARNNAPAAAAHAAVMQCFNQALSGDQGQGGYSGRPNNGSGFEQQASGAISNAVGGGVLGSVVGGLVGGIGSSLLGGAFDSPSNGAQTQTYQSSNYNQDGSYTSTTMQTGRRPQSNNPDYGSSGEQYAQAEYKNTHYPGGGFRQEYDRFDQSGSSGHGYKQSIETHPIAGGGCEQRNEKRWERPDGRWESDVQEQTFGAPGQHHRKEEHHHGRRHNGSDEESDDNDDDDYEKKERKRHEKERKKREKEERERYGGGSGGYDSDDSKHRHREHAGRGESHHNRNSREQEHPHGDFPGASYGTDDRRDRYEDGPSYGRQESRPSTLR